MKRPLHPVPAALAAAPHALPAPALASAVVTLSRKLFGDVREREVVIVGDGVLAACAARALEAEAPERVVITSPCFEAALALATGTTAIARPFEELPLLQVSADVVVTALAASAPGLTGGSWAEASRLRRHRPLLLIELARVTAPAAACATVEDLYAFDSEDLVRLIDAEQRRATARTRGSASAVQGAPLAAVHTFASNS